MYIYGSFNSVKGDTITVHILTGGSRTITLEIGDGESGVWFAPDSPVEISNEVNDCFDHLLRQSAVIRLQTSDYISNLFATTCRNVVVNIYRGSTCIFAGYVEPQSYNQPYNEALDDLEINCIDALSALQYSYYRDIHTAGVDYEAIKTAAATRSFHSIITELLSGITAGLDIVGGQTVRLLYDGSKAINDDNANASSILSQINVSDLLFLGDSEDDVWTQDVVLDELLSYLNLHIAQEGFNFLLFSWETEKAASNVSWTDLLHNHYTLTTSYRNVAIANSIAEDCATNISIGDVYNQIMVTCDVNELENVIESPLDDEMLIQLYSRYQKYLTEFSVEGNGSKAKSTFRTICTGDSADDVNFAALNYREGSITDWFIRMKTAKGWIFPRYGVETDDLVEICCQNDSNQHTLPLWLSSQMGACIMAWGNIETTLAHTDNSPVSKLTFDDCLVVSVNGNNDDTNPAPDMNDIKDSIPIAVYEGGSAASVFSPADDAVTNYLVVSGSLVLNPLMRMSCNYTDAATVSEPTPVPSRSNDHGRLYTRLYWQAPTPADDPVHADNPSWGLLPFTGKGPEQYEYKYSGIGDSTDQVSKVAVLACMLIIGDKCVVETGTDGTTSDFEWRTYKTHQECASDDEYYNQCFFIGINPKIGDKLIGTEFSIANNISYTMDLDAEGMAIPITKDDHVSGPVTFKILGAVNTYWDEWTRRHSTWFRHSSYSANSVPLLAHISNIVVKDLNIKAYSDNGGLEVEEDNDLVYLSDTNEEFFNRKEIDFKLTSALTATEASELGVTNTVNMSTPQSALSGSGVLSIYDRVQHVTAKPEKLYVDSYYKEMHRPRVTMQQSVTDDAATVNRFYHYTHPAMSKAFYVLGVSRDLKMGVAILTLREIGND